MAAKKKTGGPSAATVKYVMADQLSSVGLGADVDDSDGVLRFSQRGVPYATFRIDGNEQVLTVRKPENVPAEVKLDRFFTPGPIPGWVTFRTEVSRRPQPWLEANVGMLTGQIKFEINHATELLFPQADLTIAPVAPPAKAAPTLLGPAWSDGGPYLLAPAKAAGTWRGFHDEKAYFAMAREADPAKLAKIGKADVIVFGAPEPLYVFPIEGGVLFAMANSFEAADDAILPPILGALPSDGWTSVGEITVPGGEVRLFDSALGGESTTDGISFSLPKGHYEVTRRPHFVDGQVDLMVHRLRATTGL